MTPRRFRRSLASLTMAAAVALGLATGPTAPTAYAAPGNIVTFGDSFVAAPDQYVAFGLVAPEVAAKYPRTDGCIQAPDNWPRLLAKKTGREVRDWSCNGTTSREMLGRIDRAIRAGALNSSTGVVAMSVGMNNYSPYGFTKDGVNFLDPAAVRSNYLADLSAAARKIRAVAPNAQIILPGMLSVTTNGFFCMVNVVPEMPLGLPIPVLADVERWNSTNQRDAASRIGADFIDVKSASAAHSSCTTPDAERMVSGWLDVTTPNWTMINHPSRKGNHLVADLVAASLR
ncbi:GDSL-type esterase/lipase family protein [Corynebacterium variabile]|uniref:GDSL-type esterase/lipase family protein n=2 Tax=Corynebacterium variabile TaxID=1727 RepID=UPI003A8DD03A